MVANSGIIPFETHRLNQRDNEKRKKEKEEMSSVTPADIPDFVYPLAPVTPVRGSIVGADGLPGQDEELSAPLPKRSHIV